MPKFVYNDIVKVDIRDRNDCLVSCAGVILIPEGNTMYQVLCYWEVKYPGYSQFDYKLMHLFESTLELVSPAGRLTPQFGDKVKHKVTGTEAIVLDKKPEEWRLAFNDGAIEWKDNPEMWEKMPCS